MAKLEGYCSFNVESDDSDDEKGRSHAHHLRRNSFSDDLQRPREFFVNVGKTKNRILRQEDTDGDERVTIEDKGPKQIDLPSHHTSAGYFRHPIKGNYMISNLLQELALLDSQLPAAHGPPPLRPPKEHAIIRTTQLSENPVDRLNRMIRKYFWPALVRRIDADGLTLICMDPKGRCANKQPRVYVPYKDEFAYEYFQGVAASRQYLNLEVIRLPERITSEYVRELNGRPGILCLDLECVLNDLGESTVIGKPFVVPGGRFNELYGWDSYFIILGLLEDKGNLQNIYLARSIIDNLVYEIEHYGMILNANRTYYLQRSQPPFLTDMALQVHSQLIAWSIAYEEGRVDSPISSILGNLTPSEWLRRIIIAAIQEYRQVWMSEPRFIPALGLSRYCSEVTGVPPETESTHFDSLLTPFMGKYCIVDKSEFITRYNDGRITEPTLDEYFLHDRAVRESGHDTTFRLDGRAARLCTVDLCALLYKYEVDIAHFIKDVCDGQLELPDGSIETSMVWVQAADRRKLLADKFLWNEDRGMYFDYDFIADQQSSYESVTTLWPLWSEMASPQQAARLVQVALPKFEEAGGLVSGTKESLGTGDLTLNRPNRQWDHPFGWAPHQMLAWHGLYAYGFHADARRLAYRWLYMITSAFSDFNGVVPEKFDVVKMSHKVDVEYGNVGTDFKMVPREGFGWMNASYLVGQRYLSLFEKRALGALVHPHSLLRVLNDSVNQFNRVQ